MDTDDLQAKAWLDEFQRSSAQVLIARTLTPPLTFPLSQQEQQMILKLLQSMLYDKANPIQQQFLQALHPSTKLANIQVDSPLYVRGRINCQ